MPQVRRFGLKGFSTFGLSGFLVACNMLMPPTSCGCSVELIRSLRLINYEGVIADSAAFILDSIGGKWNDSIDVFFNNPQSASSPFYNFEWDTDGVLSLELFKDSVTKAKAVFVLGTTAGGDALYGRLRYALVWTETVDSSGYTQLQITEQP